MVNIKNIRHELDKKHRHLSEYTKSKRKEVLEIFDQYVADKKTLDEAPKKIEKLTKKYTEAQDKATKAKTDEEMAKKALDDFQNGINTLTASHKTDDTTLTTKYKEYLDQLNADRIASGSSEDN